LLNLGGFIKFEKAKPIEVYINVIKTNISSFFGIEVFTPKCSLHHFFEFLFVGFLHLCGQVTFMFNFEVNKFIIGANSQQFIRNNIIFFPVYEVSFCRSMFGKHIWIQDFDLSVADGLIFIFLPQTHFQTDIRVRVNSFCVIYLFCGVPITHFASNLRVIILIFNFKHITCVVMMH
jgi:hypothetical protein